MTKTQVAQGVADRLFATEEAVDTAMVRAAGLLQSMVEARRELGVAATTGEVAQARTAEAISALSEARRAVMAAHSALASLAGKMELEDLGGPDKPEEDSDRTVKAIRLATA